MVKSSSPSTFNRAGQMITYSFLVTNTGNVTLSGVLVNDTDLPGLSAIACRPGTLAPAADETCTATYSTTQADVDAGSVPNTATAQGTPPGSTTPVVSDPSTATLSASQAAGISVVKSASPTIFSQAGQTIVYSFLVTNTGNVTLSAVGSTTPTSRACPRSAARRPRWRPASGDLHRDLLDHAGGRGRRIGDEHGHRPGHPAEVDDAGSVGSVDRDVPAAQVPAISLVKSASPSAVSKAGQVITYSFLVTNTGNVTLTGVLVDDTDLPGLSAISCPSATLAPGLSETCTATHSTTQADVDRGGITNTATAQGTPAGSTTPVVSDPSTVTVPAEVSRAISVVKSASPATYSRPGQTISYSFLVTNTGNVTLSAVAGRLTRTCPACRRSAARQDRWRPGRVETCTATYVTTQAERGRGLGDQHRDRAGRPAGVDDAGVVDPSSVTSRHRRARDLAGEVGLAVDLQHGPGRRSPTASW